MPPIDPTVRIYREAAARAVEHWGLRPTARAVGMTAPGLQLFLDGSTPQQRTLKKLREWYLREQKKGAPGGPDLATIQSALDALLQGVPEPTRSRARAKLLRAAAWAYSEAGIEAPAWLTEARRRPGEGAG